MRQALAIVLPAIACALAVALITGWAWTRPVTATASATFPAYTAVFVAEGLLDGEPRSVWLPGARRAHVDLQFANPQTFAAVTVTNADNFPHHDVRTLDYHVELFDQDRLVLSVSRRFEGPTETQRIETEDTRADRIRVTLDSSVGGSGCLGDVGWEPR